MDEDNDYVQNAAFLHERNLTEPLENVLVNLGHSPQLYKDTTRSISISIQNKTVCIRIWTRIS